MPKKKQSIQSQDRPDLHMKEADYIQKVPRPNFDMTRDERLRDGYNRGLTLTSLLKSSGYTPRQLFAKLGLDEVTNHKLYEQLTETYSKLRENRK